MCTQKYVALNGAYSQVGMQDCNLIQKNPKYRKFRKKKCITAIKVLKINIALYSDQHGVTSMYSLWNAHS